MFREVIPYTYQATEHGRKDGKVGLYDIEAEITVEIRNLPEGLDGAFAVKIVIGDDLDLMRTSDPAFRLLGDRIAAAAFDDEAFTDRVCAAFGIEWRATPALDDPYAGRYVRAA